MGGTLVQEALDGRFGPSDQDRDAWLAARRQGVTATEIRDLYLGKVTIAGLVNAKLGRAATMFGGNVYTRWGTEREPLIAEVVQAQYGIEPESRLVRADDDPRKLASPDGIGFDFDGGLLVSELKTTGKPIPLGSDLLAEKGYEAQMTWVMRVTGARRCLFGWEMRLAHLTDGNEPLFQPGELTFEWFDYDETFAAELDTLADRLLAALDTAAVEPFSMPTVDEGLDTHAVNYLRFLDAEREAGNAKRDEYDAILAEVGERESFQQEGMSARITLTPMKTSVRVEVDVDGAMAAAPDLWAALTAAEDAWKAHLADYTREVTSETKPRLTITAIKQKGQTS